MEEKKFLLAAIVVAVLVLAGSAGWVYWSRGKSEQIRKTEPVQTGPFLKPGEGEKELQMPGETPLASPKKEGEKTVEREEQTEEYRKISSEARKWYADAYPVGAEFIFGNRDIYSIMRIFFASKTEKETIYKVAYNVQEKTLLQPEKVKKDIFAIRFGDEDLPEFNKVKKSLDLNKVLEIAANAGGKNYESKTFRLVTGFPFFDAGTKQSLWRVTYGVKDLVILVDEEEMSATKD